MGRDDELVILNPSTGRERHLAARFRERGNAASGVGNMAVYVELEIPSLIVEHHARELGKKVAVMVRNTLSERHARGQDAQGRALPPLAQATIKRRARRVVSYGEADSLRDVSKGLSSAARRTASLEDDIGAHKLKRAISDQTERFTLRGRSYGKGGPYVPRGGDTPYNESGLAADNVAVEWKGTESGDPIWQISFASGGKERGLENDDGRGARLFAVRHYGWDRMADIPRDLDGQIDEEMAKHLDGALAAGVGLVNAAWEAGSNLARRSLQLIETAQEEQIGA
jgi:hypothetical protein